MRNTLRMLTVFSGGGGLSIVNFTQSLGSNLVSNGGMETGNPPTGWDQDGSPTTREQSTAQAHGGTNSLHIVADQGSEGATTIPTVTANRWCEVESYFYVEAGQARLETAFGLEGSQIITATGAWHLVTFIGYNTGANPRVRHLSNGGAAEFYTDDASLKILTPNAVTVVAVSPTIQAQFILPATTGAGQIYRLHYRRVDDANYWVAYLRRNSANTAWDFRLDSVVAETATNRVNVTGVGNVNTIKVVVSGDNHTCYTSTDGIDGTFTQRGSVITNTTHNTATGMHALYSTGFTPVRIKVT